MPEEIQLLSFKRAFYPGHSPLVSYARVVENSKGLFSQDSGVTVFVYYSGTFRLKGTYL